MLFNSYPKTITLNDNNYILRSTHTNQCVGRRWVYTGATVWTNYVTKLKIKFTKGNIGTPEIPFRLKMSKGKS